jgi:hypothetical protein
MMAFGAGALLFAVTVELYAHALLELQHREIGMWQIFATTVAAMVGALLYLKTVRVIEEHLMTEMGVVDQLGQSKEFGEKLKRALVQKRWQKIRDVVKAARVARYFMNAPFQRQQSDPEERKEGLHDVFAKCMNQVKYDHSFSDLAFEEERKQNVARSKVVGLQMFYGVLIDSLAGGVLMGVMAAEGHLAPVLVISIFIALFGPAFASSSLMKQGEMGTGWIIGMWTALCLMLGGLAAGSCAFIFWVTPEFGSPGAHLPVYQVIGVVVVEGLAGGTMMACITELMLPEAFTMAGKEGNLFMSSGFLCVCGFLVSVDLKAMFG